ncbi:LysM peptidoglycan-binding domain-containing protein [Paenibacillus sp. GD4]|jgi:peptidoglycan LD-endopeptidase LytH|uniref:LysM peptidoglycan-binding domain-containing protein n=1 Tax=Paenibacillus sp. GD4 TaxID=3068890 RepID=UPI002796B4E3|nr:LysM peptidoglycan-binding domain-containing protein [Paenibacillus sp. GD4]MDQ1909065.1 LysM peptidoglycan-binding domain-containing protein [Paenibacillus sp. GD4]
MKRKKTNKNWISLALAAALTASAFGPVYAAEPTYQVKAGDVLWKIAAAHNVTIAQLKQWNGLTGDMIYVGQTLRLTAPEIRYTVKAGDSLYLIAQTYQVLVADIKLRNQLTSDNLQTGTVLSIPAQKGSYATHTVIAGDSLFIVARDYGLTIAELKSFNQLTSDVIYVGQVLKLTASSNNMTMKAAESGPSAPAFLKDAQFPLRSSTYEPFTDTWAESRSYGGDRTHEGTDILAAEGTPIYSATDGVVINYGWNTLGGWRLTVRTSEGYILYYAHMSKYAQGMSKGATVTKGQLIGYVGSTGYGPEGTSGTFVSHLHFGMYDANWVAMNPYAHLKYWEYVMRK